MTLPLETLTLDQARQALGVSIRTLDRLRAGAAPALRTTYVAGRPMVRRAELDRYLTRQTGRMRGRRAGKRPGSAHSGVSAAAHSGEAADDAGEGVSS